MITERWTAHALRHAFAESLGRDGDPAQRRALARAALALGTRMQDLRQKVRMEKLEAYRTYLGEVVTTVSPLLLRLCADEGHDLDELVGGLRPGVPWHPWHCGTRPRDEWQRSLAGKVNVPAASPTRRASHDFQEYVHSGVTVRDRAEPGCGIPFGIRILNGGVEMAAFLGEHRLRTHGRDGSIMLRLELPCTLVEGLPGVMLDDLVDHPLLAGAGCVITSVDEPHRKWGTKVRFAHEPAPWRMPWVRAAADADL